MTAADLEAIYEALAIHLDNAGEDKRELFLAKLALLLAMEVPESARVHVCIADAAANLDLG